MRVCVCVYAVNGTGKKIRPCHRMPRKIKLWPPKLGRICYHNFIYTVAGGNYLWESNHDKKNPKSSEVKVFTGQW